MTDTYNDQTLTFLIKEIKEKVDRLEAQNSHLEKTLFKMTANHEHMEAIIKKMIDEDERQKKICQSVHLKHQNSLLVWIKNNENLVKKIIYGFALLIVLLRVSQDQLVGLIKILINGI